MKYEYKSVFAPETLDWHSPNLGLNELGNDGWELCCEISNRLIFKRQIPATVKKEDLEKFLGKLDSLSTKRFGE